MPRGGAHPRAGNARDFVRLSGNTPGMPTIRPATEADLPVLQDIERAAGKPFADIGMTAVADDEPPPLATLREFQRAGRAWVATDDSDRPIAYLVLGIVDGNAHVDQVSVDPEYAGRRIGKHLIDHAVDWARAHDLPAITLTTFTEVSWNGPYYERLGFRYLASGEETPGLRALRRAEADHGLDRWPRACMRAELATWVRD
ncbi:Ribosomal protein S18 acetylase RimI [Nocardia amikacinitolerans]|uniref:Ribosomal protein S18 acetylase RimI n=2 Tax=Nocardia amikacinitolerans TaxID=756689 RepID=A0A285LBG0_9NOCA|nr:Ribosomal protein S18 acetylase RimI [Nocardia amikacinitolerans]SNY82192.1 Ribosomal protein S18 acetylase RimI [Nocardia amikacinitolerans]